MNFTVEFGKKQERRNRGHGICRIRWSTSIPWAVNRCVPRDGVEPHVAVFIIDSFDKTQIIMIAHLVKLKKILIHFKKARYSNFSFGEL